MAPSLASPRIMEDQLRNGMGGGRGEEKVKRRGGVEGMFGKSVKQKGGPEAGICVAVQRVCTVHVVRIHICAMCF